TSWVRGVGHRHAGRLLEQREIGLAEQIAAKQDDDVARRLNVHRPVHDSHQRAAEPCEIGSDVGIVVTEWPRMHAGNEEAADLEVEKRTAADERLTSIAC